MPSLFEQNPMIFKGKDGFDYPEFKEIYEKATLSTWTHHLVSMESDLRDWQNISSPQEKAVIAGILKGFVARELGIGCYWSNDVCRMFPKPEIQAMARAFSYFEWIHAFAYSYLNDTLGLNEYKEFIEDEVAIETIKTFFSEYPDKVKLAVFSGAGEGVSLFAAFAVLLSFNRQGRYKGLAQIISWSAIDEQKHTDAGILLFNKFVEEAGITEEEIESIYEGFRLIVTKEFLFIDHIFNNAQIESIDSSHLKSYIKIRANEQLVKLNLEPIFALSPIHTKDAQDLAAWFEPLAFGVSSNDFFTQPMDGSNYVAVVSQDFDSVDLSTLVLEY